MATDAEVYAAGLAPALAGMEVAGLDVTVEHVGGNLLALVVEAANGTVVVTPSDEDPDGYCAATYRADDWAEGGDPDAVVERVAAHNVPGTVTDLLREVA